MIQEDRLAELHAFDGIDAETSRAKRVELVVVDAVDLAARPFVAPEFLVEPIVPRSGTVLLTGDTGSCKTALLVHIALSIAARLPVGGRFAVDDDERPILVLNGEMGGDLVRTYLHQAAAGIGATIPRGRVLFEGNDGVSGFRFSESREALEELVATCSPAAVFFDTQRALFGLDENDTGAVRIACRWLQRIAEEYRLVNVLTHHLRKLGPVSNSERERVAGSRDWIAAVDVHLAAKSRDGHAMHALTLGKTRFPTRNAIAGTEWPIEARLELGADPPRSIIVVNDPSRTPETQPLEDVADEMRSRLEADGPLTIEQLGAGKGNAKRAYEQLRAAGEVVDVGKDGRKRLYGLAGIHDAPDLLETNAVKADRTRDRVREKPNNHAGLNAVKARPRSDRDGTSGPDAVGARSSADRSSVPPTVLEVNERGQRSDIYSDRDLDRVRDEAKI